MLAILSCKKCEWSVCMRKKCAFLKRNWAECRVFMLETRFARLPFHPAVKVYSESGREKSLMVQLTQKRSVTPQLPLYLAGWNPISFAFFKVFWWNTTGTSWETVFLFGAALFGQNAFVPDCPHQKKNTQEIYVIQHEWMSDVLRMCHLI